MSSAGTQAPVQCGPWSERIASDTYGGRYAAVSARRARHPSHGPVGLPLVGPTQGSAGARTLLSAHSIVVWHLDYPPGLAKQEWHWKPAPESLISFNVGTIIGLLNEQLRLREVNVPPLDVISAPKASDFELYANGRIPLDDYRGMSVAIWEGKVIGTGATSADALRQARTVQPDAKPLLVEVPDEEPGIF